MSELAAFVGGPMHGTVHPIDYPSRRYTFYEFGEMTPESLFGKLPAGGKEHVYRLEAKMGDGTPVFVFETTRPDRP